MKMSKLSCLALASLALIGVVGGTIAYFNQELRAENQFLTGKFDTTIEEDFTPPDGWTPGADIKKDVWVKNTGNVDVVARAKLTDIWIRTEDITNPSTGEIISKKDDVLANVFTDENGIDQEAALKHFAEDGGVPLMVEYVEGMDIGDAAGKWLHLGDYYYYIGTIKGGEESSHLLESVEMNPLLENTVSRVITRTYQDEQGKKKMETTYTMSEYGYDSAKYTLTIDVQTVQASKEAVSSLWKEDDAAVRFIKDHFCTIE